MFNKKNLLILGITLLLSLTLVGCGEKDAPKGSKGTDSTDGEVYELKFAHVVRPTTPKGLAAEKFKELVEEKSDGKLKVTIYPDSQMGADQEINEQVLAGTLDINAPFFATVTSFVPEFELFDLPYLFENEEQAFEALSGDVGEKLSGYLEEKNLKSLGYWSGGFKQITNSKKPVKNVKDLDGMKIRVSQSPLLVTQFKAINAGGISVPFVDLYSSLQTGTVDGQENPFANIATKKFYEVQDYMTVSNHGFMGFAFFINQEKFDSLPEDLQEVIEEVSEEVMKEQWEIANKKDQEYLDEITESGIDISEFGPKEKEEFRKATQKAYDEFLKQEGGQELIDTVEKYTKKD